MTLDEQQYNILYLEDDTRDKRIIKFKELAKAEGLSIEITKDSSSFLAKSKRTGSHTKTWDVIICDIEIWQKSEKDGVDILQGLGFSYIEDLIKKGFDYIYLILSNTSTSFFNKISSQIPSIKDVRQKDKVFKSEDSIKSFIKEIKRHINDKKEKLIEKTPTTTSIFEVYDNYIHNKTNYPLTIKLKDVSTICYDYCDIENIISNHLAWLISEWAKISTNFDKTKRNDEMRNVAAILKLGGEFRKTKEILYKNTEINNFIRKLILRRFVIYVASTNSLSLKDACLTISGQEKCFDNILLFSNLSNTYSEKELEYKKRLET